MENILKYVHFYYIIIFIMGALIAVERNKLKLRNIIFHIGIWSASALWLVFIILRQNDIAYGFMFAFLILLGVFILIKNKN